MLRVEQIYTDSPLRNFTYLLYDSEGSLVVSIDPWDPLKIIRRLTELGLELTHIINTHEHADHTAGNIHLVNRYNARVLGHERASKQIPCFSEPLGAHQSLAWKDASLEALDTPGHTFAHLSLLWKENGRVRGVFSGDTLFNAGVGNCYNGGDPEVLFETIQSKYKVLEDDVLLYPGHDYLINNLKFTLKYEPENLRAAHLLKEYRKKIRDNPEQFLVTTMGLERDINTFLRCDQERLRQELGKHGSHLENASEKEVFLFLRRLRNRW